MLIGFAILGAVVIGVVLVSLDQVYHAGYSRGYKDGLDVAAEDVINAFGLEEK